MFYEIILLSVIVVTAYVGPMVLRHTRPGERTYALLVFADLALAIIAFAGRRAEGPGGLADLLGAIAIGAAVFLVMVPPILRDLARRALAADRLRLAAMLIDARELLSPGMGARHERELLDAVIAARSGRADDAVAVLAQTKEQIADPLARRQLDERITQTYLLARRWGDAIRHFETNLWAREGPVSPQLQVEMVRAYCEERDLEGAAQLLARLEDSPLATEPVLSLLVNRARLVFLAHVGRTGAVEGLVGSGGPLGGAPDAVRHFWRGVARLNAGDRSGARSSLQDAAQLAGRDRRSRQIALDALARIDTPGMAGPHAIPPFVAELADRVAGAAAASKPPPASRQVPMQVTWRRVPVTCALVAANLAAATAVALIFGATTDVGALVRAGGSLESAVRIGEWWRLVSSIFLHVGILHLGLNMLGLWVLGRLLEQMLGSIRFFAVYMVGGLGGAIASHLVGGGGMSIGASGAVLAVMGAAVVELALGRQGYPPRWRRELLGALLFFSVAQIGIGLAYAAIDQAAHIGGFLAGAAACALLSRQHAVGKSAATRVVAGVLAGAGLLALIYGAWGVATTSYADTLGKFPRVERQLAGVTLTVPSHWEPEDGLLVDPSGAVLLALERGTGDLGTALAAIASDETAAREIKHREDATPVFEMPEPWRARELRVTVEGLGGDQTFRVVVFGREAGDELVTGLFRLPEALARDMREPLRAILAGARVAP